MRRNISNFTSACWVETGLFGSKGWSRSILHKRPAERLDHRAQLMAALVAKTNESTWCTKTHGAVAEQAYRDSVNVLGVLSDLETAGITEPLRAALAAGCSREQIEDALAVCFSFNTIGRLADAFGFFVPGSRAFKAGAKYLLARGYR